MIAIEPPDRTVEKGQTEPKISEPDALPKGWHWTTLREIADIKGGITKGQRFRPDQRTRPVPYLRVANVQRGHLDLSEVKTIEARDADIEVLRLKVGDILFNEGGDRDKLGRGWVWNDELPECIHQNHVFRARLRGSENDPRFVSYYSNSAGQRYFWDQGKHTTNLASINLTKLGALPIPLPPPEEQKRIVAAIEKQLTRLDAGVASLRRVQASLKRYRASVLKAELQRSNWETKRLAQVVEKGAAVLYGILQPGPQRDDGVPYVRPTEIDRDTIQMSEIRRTSRDIAVKYQRSALAEGDVILSIVGTIGKVAIVPSSLHGGNITQSSVRIRAASDVIDNRALPGFLWE